VASRGKNGAERNDLLLVNLPEEKEESEAGMSSRKKEKKATMIVVGDSIIREGVEKMKRDKFDVNARCFPGAGIDRIGEEVRKIAEEEGGRMLEGKTVVLSAGGNDVDKYRGRSEELVQEVLPRTAKSAEWNNLVLSLNTRLEHMCRNDRKLKFVHFWNAYWGETCMFRDGVHLTEMGGAYLASGWTYGVAAMQRV
jgi:hypothetical protein